MLICEHAHNLFDAYLDDELSSSMRMELNAHRLSCVRCQQQLTLLESCADVVSRDQTAPALSDGFTDRVMAALPAMTVTAPRTARIYRLFAPVGAVAAAIAMVIMLTPPASSTKEAASNATQVADSDNHPKALTAPAVVVASDGQDGKTIINTLAIEPGQTEPLLKTSEYDTPLPKAMVDGGLTPTVQGWQQLRSDGTTFRELGKIMLERAVSNVAGQQAVPAVGSPTATVRPVDEDAETDEVGDLLETDEDQPL